MFVKTELRKQPRYREIAEVLRRRIVEHVYAPGENLPSEARLCTEFETSRGPVRQAVDLLRQEGLVAVSRGAAPRVLDAPTSAHSFESLVSFTEWAESVGRTAGQRTVELRRVPATSHVAAQLQLAPSAAVIEVLRLRTLDGVPAMVERATFPLEVGRWLFEPDFDPDSASIYRQLRARGVDLAHGEHLIDAAAASNIDAELLQIEQGAPLLRVRRVVTSGQGAPLEMAEDRYRPGIADISLTNTAGAPASIFHLTPGRAVS